MFGPTLSDSDTEAQVGFLFHVLIGTNPFGVFRSVSGIGRRVDAEELREGGRNHSPHMRVSPSKYQECKIEWGLTNSTALYDWIHAVEAGYAYKRAVTVVQFNRMMVPLRIFLLWDAWPLSWEGARLNANDNSVDTEEITLAYEAVTLVPIPTEVSWDSPIPETTWLSDPTAFTEETEAIELHDSDTRIAEEYVPPVEDTPVEEEETAHVNPSRPAERVLRIDENDPARENKEFSAPTTEATREDPPPPQEGRLAEEADGSEAVSTRLPDYGDERMARAEFPAIAFSSGTFYRHEAQVVKLSSGLFFEPTVWEDYE